MPKAAAAILMIFVTRYVFAFSGDEHIYVSNLALRIALARATHLKPAVREELTKFTVTEKHSFGDVVALADQIKDEAPIFDVATHQCPKTFDDVDWDHFERLGKETLRSLQAKSLNENHFQSLALATHLAAHHAAIGEARNDRWIRALLFEAYALHHIEDFLSPGHVATARAGMADFVAIGLHDKYTDRGLDFRFDGDLRLLQIAEDAARLPASDFMPVAKMRKSTDLVLTSDDFTKLAEAMRKKSDPLPHFLGDSHLHEQKIQAAFVVVIAALSLEEVLFDYAGDAFAEYCWQWRGQKQPDCAQMLPQNRRWSMLRVAQIPGGRYEAVVPPVQFFVPGEVLFVTLQNAVNPDEDVNNREGGLVGTRDLHIEALLFAIPEVSKRQVVRTFAPSVLVGYRRGVGPGPSSHAAQARLIAPIPRTNLLLSYSRAFELGGRRGQAESGVLEAGFGFLFVRIGAQRNREKGPPLEGGHRRESSIPSGCRGSSPSGQSSTGRKDSEIDACLTAT